MCTMYCYNISELMIPFRQFISGISFEFISVSFQLKFIQNQEMRKENWRRNENQINSVNAFAFGHSNGNHPFIIQTEFEIHSIFLFECHSLNPSLCIPDLVSFHPFWHHSALIPFQSSLISGIQTLIPEWVQKETNELTAEWVMKPGMKLAKNVWLNELLLNEVQLSSDRLMT